jgi:hypothetical protein
MEATMKPWCWLTLAACLGPATACSGPGAGSTSEVVVVTQDRLPTDPGDPSWGDAPFHRAELLLQDMVEPRLLEPSTRTVDVRAVTDGTRIAFKLSWHDATRNDLPGAARFVDACAVQLPQVVAPDVPAPQMGESGRGVEITYWRSSWQATVDGRADTIESLYPGASIDHYPFAAPSLADDDAARETLESQYAPARALGGTMAGPRERPVQDLLAEGPGTLVPMSEQSSEGRGRRGEEGWEVVLVRRLPYELDRDERTQVAFAIWDGEHEEVGARKMRSGWIGMHLQGDEG